MQVQCYTTTKKLQFIMSNMKRCGFLEQLHQLKKACFTQPVQFEDHDRLLCHQCNKMNMATRGFYHCGGESQLANNNTIKRLISQYATVLPVCCICYNAGKEPATWGTNNNLKRKKFKKTLHQDYLSSCCIFN